MELVVSFTPRSVHTRRSYLPERDDDQYVWLR